MMVELLRSGRASGIAGLFSFGLVPDVFAELDYVTGTVDPVTGGQMEVTRRPLWSWVHEAPEAGGAEVCWGKLNSVLDRLSPRAKAEKLQQALNLAVKAALVGGSSAPLGFTWEQMLGYTQGVDGGVWTRSAMVAVLETQCSSHLGQSMPVLQALNDFGHVVRPDFIAWLSRSNSLMEQAIANPQPELVQFLASVTDLVEKKAVWQGLAEKGLAQFLSLGEDTFNHEGVGSFMHEQGTGLRLVAVVAALQAFAPHCQVPTSVELLSQYAEVEKSWSAMPSVLRELLLNHQLPVAAPTRAAKPRF